MKEEQENIILGLCFIFLPIISYLLLFERLPIDIYYSLIPVAVIIGITMLITGFITLKKYRKKLIYKYFESLGFQEVSIKKSNFKSNKPFYLGKIDGHKCEFQIVNYDPSLGKEAEFNFIASSKILILNVFAKRALTKNPQSYLVNPQFGKIKYSLESLKKDRSKYIITLYRPLENTILKRETILTLFEVGIELAKKHQLEPI